ncbi:hypothetical protein HDU86_004967 [Geranomyces michiganensis]|nr:hypothetical protein HDU86_004967 [Geranomyces michiganensis]
MLAESNRAAGDAIRVVCRFRPQNAREVREGGQEVVSFDDELTSVRFESREYPGTFNFDKVFGSHSTQDHVFSYAASATIDDVMRGYNGTIFAYGQTGSGKTHTMMGDMENDAMKGLTPRIVESIFSTIFSSPAHLEFTVRVSFMEIYMEKIRDLLNPANDNLPIHEEKSRGVYVKGLLEVFVGSIAEVYDAMRRGQSSRMVAQTNMNAESSRSHSIFVLTITQKNLEDGSQKVGKLSLVDLAGSEKVGKTGASGQTLEEAKKINKSLSALGMVINALTDGKSSHIPYRDSKLTRILQESLGGNSRTTLIINCSPSSFNEAETVSTLRFGMRAKTIKNKAKINAELSPGELKALLKRCKADLASMQTYCHALEQEINVWRSGGMVSEKDWVTALDLANPPSEAKPTPSTSAPLPLPSVADLTRASTPAIATTDDEREEFLRRENELSDQLAEKEAELEQVKAQMEALTIEVTAMRTGDSKLENDNKILAAAIADLHLQVEKLEFERKDALISIDSMKDEKTEAAKVIDDLKRKIVELQATQHVIPVTPEERERRKKEKMAKMAEEFDPSISSSEKAMRASLAKLAHLKANSAPPKTPEDIEAQHVELLEAKARMVEQDALLEIYTTKVQSAEDDKERLDRRSAELENKLGALEQEYEELLDRTIQEETSGAGPEVAAMFEDLKGRLESVYESRSSHAETEIQEYRSMLARKEEDLVRMQAAIAEQRQVTGELRSAVESVRAAGAEGSAASIDADEDIQALRKKMAKELADFDGMKQKLMQDLKNRCDRVVELEITLEDMKDQYDAIAKPSDSAEASAAQAQKMAFLERNLEQLAAVQKNLVEQNTMMKKDLIKSERQLAARNERIANLEGLLHDASTNQDLLNQKYEAQLASMREKLQEARSPPQQNINSASAWLYSSRIAKPLRGSGGAFIPASDYGSDNLSLDLEDTPSKSRASWYISLLAKK